MAYQIPGYCIGTLLAGEDLSSAQFTFVKLGANGRVTQVDATTDDKIIGVLQNKPKEGQPADICILGVTKVEAKRAVAVARGSYLKAGPNGRVENAGLDSDGNEIVVGLALEHAPNATTSRVISALISLPLGFNA